MNKKLLVFLALVGAALSGWLLLAVSSMPTAGPRAMQVPVVRPTTAKPSGSNYVPAKTSGKINTTVMVGTQTVRKTIQASVMVVK